ncbi:hypothetical protein CW751_04125 [Brumimicrobium salinarum]|uniref:histidine kinase n=1 Tax=Brumimicrobium salinarum TaxID=2058658 RepID=A0A2I0R556_9FLAO|nr:ATP-binding protein [Brumimicrobium salinarum]PKR81722.1 hypothetical protein CW751_04125 [Brumimicrobium salinarum]
MQVKIAFINIIINAIEAMDERREPILKIDLKTENGRPSIRISDNGKGMDEETMNNLFDPFFTNRRNGLGLGMTATLNIINMHKGKIIVDSKLDQGTVFTITL